MHEPSSNGSENLTDNGYSMSTIVGAIVGGIAGLFAAIFFIGVLVYVFIIARRNKEKQNGKKYSFLSTKAHNGMLALQSLSITFILCSCW